MKKKKTCIVLLLITLTLFSTNASYAQNAETVSMKEIVEASIQHSQKLKISGLNSSKAELSIKKAYRSYIPSITLSAGYTHLNDDLLFPDDLNTLLSGTQWLLIKEAAGLPYNQAATPEILGMLAQKGVTIKETPPIQEKDIWKANVTAQMILFSGGKIPYSIKAAQHQEKSINLLSEQEKSNLTLEVIEYYDKFAVVSKSEEVLINTENYLKEQTRFVEKAFKNGLATDLELQKIELAKQQLAAKKIELTTAKKLLAAKLSQLSGLEAEKLEFSKPNLKILAVGQQTNDVSQRKDIQALNEAIVATDYARKAELTSYVPKIVAFGMKELIKQDLSILDPEWAVGVKLQWNIFDGFTSSTMVQQRKLDKLILEERRDEAIELLQLKQTKENLELEKNTQLIEVAAQKVKIAQKAYDLSKKQYEQGLITQNDHLTSVNELEKAQLDEIQAIYNQRMAALNYLQTTGNLDINNI